VAVGVDLIGGESTEATMQSHCLLEFLLSELFVGESMVNTTDRLEGIEMYLIRRERLVRTFPHWTRQRPGGVTTSPWHTE